MKCTHCGARIPQGENVCPGCGRRAVGYQEHDAATETPVNNKPLMIAMIAVLAVLIVVPMVIRKIKAAKEEVEAYERRKIAH